MNRDFLQHDYYTDIITFGLSEKNQPIEAEIYISIDRVKDNALSLGVAYKEEMLRVIFHGALHLCGYKDKTKSEISAMRAKEDQYLQLFAKTQK
jgi:rRNA maturation RNase YbeY